ncbi:gamma-glutamyl-gamma-aminobutyrate hydrolase family protein [Asticcacaulis benevestitus]|uniref:Uncharacterized protein n=1 Tax=Asticcacaulis benevestitus DSM 16100 = ATCC BAA-896 TaxID=1121022 RepID=V4P0T7_9CAUL|nr:gamma-glutamyl-gamma-aminobutyrate hydrolase family protein [Asticcacaulis benevestitus]ESQ81736.1 hypothetical protein ABENE_21590 [Asticcacaulis benevestitus DSM 16100 = ATCC BAA-896]
MTTPVLGIMSCNRTVGPEQAYAVMQRYVDAALKYSGCAALMIPASSIGFRPDVLASHLDALLLTGSPSNIEGKRYGATPGEGPFDAERDEVALGMVQAMVSAGKPIFGICRGFQEINVALGGSLRRDVGGDAAGEAGLRHHAPNESSFEGMFAHEHDVNLVPFGVLKQLYTSGNVQVNSVHYQGIDRLADGLRAEAVAPDGLIEAYSGNIEGADILAVQWHPEWDVDARPQSQAFFRMIETTLTAKSRRLAEHFADHVAG